MKEQFGVIIIIPAFNEEEYVNETILSIPKDIDLVLFINDGSTDLTTKNAEDAFKQKQWSKIGNTISKSNYLIINQKNKGVGAAVCTGLKQALELFETRKLAEFFPNKKEWFVVIMDADGQMDPKDIKQLINPLITNLADHVKGNRIDLEGMPKSRKLGSFLLKKLMRFASGYPEINDTQCGYRAINIKMLQKWNFSNFWNGFGYTNWWILESGRRSFRLAEIPVRCIYNEKKSKLKIRTFLPNVSLLIFMKLWKRGWDWYVIGKGTESKLLMGTVTILWFSSLGSIISIPLFSMPWLKCITYSVISLFIVKKLDDNESERRHKNGKYPLIN